MVIPKCKKVISGQPGVFRNTFGQQHTLQIKLRYLFLSKKRTVKPPFKDIKNMIRTMLFFISLIPLAISPSQGMSQINEIEGVFLGRVENGYSFCGKTALAMEEIVVFDEILSVILEKYPLHEDKHIGENFIISFIENVGVREDDNKVTSTVIRLQKLASGQHL